MPDGNTIQLYGGISYTLPLQPPKKQIWFNDLPKSKQKWYRPDLETLYYEAEDKIKFEISELDRRINGVWFYNNGEPTYITGSHYYELTYCRCAFGFPEYRDVARRWWYFWDAAKRDRNCLGTLRAKFRRMGATTDGEAEMLNIATSTPDILCGLVSKTNQSAKDTFNEIVDIMQYMPDYSLPPMEGTDRPKAEISFREPSARLTKNNTTVKKSNSLNSKINYRATVTNAYDGQPLKYIMVDEAAKWTKDNPFTRFWDIHKTCLMKGSQVYGKAYIPSTINEMEHSGGKEYKEVWDMSDPSDLNDNGRTKSGLWRYFNPAFDGLQGFIDEYGMSVIDTPTKEQAAYIGSKIGAKEYLENERKALEKNPESLYEQIRQFPFNEKEAFLTASKGSQFDLMRVNDQFEWNTTAINERLLIIQQGNFVWKDGRRDTEVQWIPQKNGKWKISWFPKPEMQNKYYMKGGQWFPSFHAEGCFGIDPVDKASTNFKRQSMYACYGYRYPQIFDEKYSNLFFCEYVNRLPIPEDHYEDMIKMCVFYGMPCFGEINVPGTVNYFTMRGYENYLLDRPEPLRAKGGSNLKKEKWMPSRDVGIRQLMMDYLQSFIAENVGHIDKVGGFLEMPKIPFNDLLEEISKYSSDEDLTDYDRIVAAIFALGTARRNMKDKVEKKQTYIPYIPTYKVNNNRL